MYHKKIILTGYRATGKSNVGRLLSQRLSYSFLDMDQEIESREGETIGEMVVSKGWEYFRSAERALLKELIHKEKLVVGSGGGAIIHQELWPQLMDTGYVVWLHADHATICSRLSADEKTATQRPSLTQSNTLEEVEAVMQEREPLYRKFSHCDVDTGLVSVSEVVEVIEKYLQFNIQR